MDHVVDFAPTKAIQAASNLGHANFSYLIPYSVLPQTFKRRLQALVSRFVEESGFRNLTGRKMSSQADCTGSRSWLATNKVVYKTSFSLQHGNTACFYSWNTHAFALVTTSPKTSSVTTHLASLTRRHLRTSSWTRWQFPFPYSYLHSRSERG